MDEQRLEEKLTKNSEDISKLAVNMAELTAVVKAAEIRHTESMTAIHKLLEKDIEGLKVDTAEAKSDIKVLYTKVNAIDAWKNKTEGGFNVAKSIVVALWALCGSGIVAMGAWLISMAMGGNHDITD